MNVKLEEDSQRLEEVVVMGYAKDLSGSTPGLKIKQQNMVAEAKPIYIVVEFQWMISHILIKKKFSHWKH